MKKGLLISLIVGAALLIFAVIIIIYTISTINTETKLRNQVEAKQIDNKNELDNMKKKINQICQLPDAQTQMLMDIIVGNAKERASEQGKGSLFAMVQESVPNVDTSIINRLMNEIVASRNAWTMRQKELIDINREHTDCVTVFPSSMICSIFGKGSKINIKIVTSTNTEEAFRTGVDDETDLGLPKRNKPVQKIEK
jgi:hypothetical protein